jgi:hypothetical protein
MTAAGHAGLSRGPLVVLVVAAAAVVAMNGLWAGAITL